MSGPLAVQILAFLLILGCGSSGNGESDFTSSEDTETVDDSGPDANLPLDEDPGNQLDGRGPGTQGTVEIVELGSVTIGEDGLSELLTVSIPNDAISFSINAVGTEGVFFAVDALRNPNGKQLVLEGWYKSPLNGGQSIVCVVCINRIASAESAHSSLFPNTPAVELVPGEHSFRIHAFVMGGSTFQPEFNPTAGQAEVSVIIKKSKTGAPKLGLLNLNLHFTGAGGITAANAPTNERLRSAIKIFAAIYAQIGIGLGEINYRDIDEGFQVVEGFSKPGNDFEEIAGLTQGNSSGVNLFFVRELIDNSTPLSGFGVILGISGGIPGPTGIQGTGRSAVFIATDTPPGLPGGNQDHLGPTMAHETGHFLGLFHSSEFGFGQQQLHDHLIDTPENDTSNLMYYDSTSGGTKLTNSQGFALRNNPWVEFPPAGELP